MPAHPLPANDANQDAGNNATPQDQSNAQPAINQATNSPTPNGALDYQNLPMAPNEPIGLVIETPSNEAVSDSQVSPSQSTVEPRVNQMGESQDVGMAAQGNEEVNTQAVQVEASQSASPDEVVASESKLADPAQPQSIEEILVAQGALSADELNEARAESANTGKEITDVILEREMVEDEILARAKAKYYNIEYIKLSEVGVAPEALSTITEGVAQRYMMLPFQLDKQQKLLSVAMANPMDLRAIDFVEKKTGFRIKPYLTPKKDLSAVITDQYTQSLSSEVSEALKDTTTAQKKVVDVRNLGEVIREAPIAKIVETLLTFAIKARASDIHIEPQEAKTRVRYRIDGILHEKLVLPKAVHDAVVSRIKILADLKIDEKRLPQDGRFSFTLGTEEVDLRVSTLPTVNGEKVVMRLLQKSVKAPRLTELGLTGLALKNLETAIMVPNGIILITGPTGSGKTTTLYSILNRINSPKVNIVTLEDPVEYEIPGVNQVQVNNKAGLTFASGLRSFLRQDPNIIMVGEIRDKETTDLAIQASLTGHLVFSTLHTNSASGAFPRLMDMGGEPFLLSSSMTCVVAQRVVRNICNHCKEPYHPEPSVIEDMEKVMGAFFETTLKQSKQTKEDFVLYKSEGCAECNDTGYSGRIGIFEVLPVTEKIGKLILESASARAIEAQAITEGMLLMKVDGYKKVMDGITTIEEVLRVAEVAEKVSVNTNHEITQDEEGPNNEYQ